jgi:predicted tellurium resistance membrane protein TerC
MEWIFDPGIWAGLVTLTALEIVLGIDNIVFLSVITSDLPPQTAKRARQIGLALALGFRVALLFTISWIIGLTAPVFSIAGQDVSWRDIILIAGGLFLIVKSTQEVHGAIEGEEEGGHEAGAAMAKGSFGALIGQIVLIDAVFSLDSIITAIGIGQHIEVMIAAVAIAIGVMYLAAESVSAFIERHPTTKMLALSFLMLIGVALVADGLHFHIPRGYIYFAMAFAAAVEVFNVLARGQKAGAAHGAESSSAESLRAQQRASLRERLRLVWMKEHESGPASSAKSSPAAKAASQAAQPASRPNQSGKAAKPAAAKGASANGKAASQTVAGRGRGKSKPHGKSATPKGKRP